MAKTVAGYQRWADLLFVHWRIPPGALRPFIPERLAIDTFDGDAWVSLTPFTVEGARLRGLPHLPGLTRFHETNLRTYVRLGDVAGIWFFSLEAASPLAVLGARMLRLPYFVARMERGTEAGVELYSSRRLFSSRRPATLAVRWHGVGDLRPAAAGTLEHFLVERYALYAPGLGGGLTRIQVRHPSWGLRAVERLELVETLTRAAGLPELGAPALAQCTPGVEVEVLAPERV